MNKTGSVVFSSNEFEDKSDRIIAGIIVFLAVEKFVRIVRGEEGHSHGERMCTERGDIGCL